MGDEEVIAAMIISISLIPRAPEIRAEIAALGSPTWAAREAAQARLITLGFTTPGTVETLADRLDSRDAEIRMRCHGAIKHVRPCNQCHGLGWYDAAYGGGGEFEPCRECRGLGSSWLAEYLGGPK